MNTSDKCIRPSRHYLKPMVLALTLALPAGAAFAADDVVTTRSDQTVQQQFGRDSVYAFSPDRKPLTPEQTAGRDSEGIKSYAANAWHKTESFAGAAWGKVTGVFTRDGTHVSQIQPEPYGRAGGYAGSDRIAVLSGSMPLIANSAVKQSDVAAADAYREDSPSVAEQAQSNESADAVTAPSTSAEDQNPRAANELAGPDAAGDMSATDGSGYTDERDPERMPNELTPSDQTADVGAADPSAVDGSGYTEERDPERMPNDMTSGDSMSATEGPAYTEEPSPNTDSTQ
jgi:hypothetical protein